MIVPDPSAKAPSHTHENNSPVTESMHLGIAVKDQAIMAVEAVEGTDECIRRAGSLCRAGGFTVVKVAKP